MKRLIALTLVLAALLLVSCGKVGLTKKPWNEDDFKLYDESGNVIQDVENYSIISASFPEDGYTARNVKVGDDAIESFKKYDMCYGKACFGLADADEPEILTRSVNLKNILTCDEAYVFLFAFDKDFNPVDAYSPTNEDYDDAWSYVFLFQVEDGKISGIIASAK